MCGRRRNRPARPHGAAGAGQNASVPDRRLETPFPLDLPLTLGPLRRGPADPCLRIGPDEAWRATGTPCGPATLHIRRERDAVKVSAWGAGAEWALDTAPALLGFDDAPAGFEPRHPLLADLHRRFRGLRIGRSAAVVEALVPSILEQKVTSAEANRSYAALVRKFGEPAPGPIDLLLPPRPDVLAAAPYWSFHPLGIERRRADAIRRVCARSDRLERVTASAPSAASRVLTSVPGIGPWTAAEVAAVALGDPDAVSVGDFHLPNVIAWALAGERRADDARMLELLEPYRGHRLRAVRLIEAAGIAPPRRAPRAPIRSIAAI